jgi:hypothetical protein
MTIPVVLWHWVVDSKEHVGENIKKEEVRKRIESTFQTGT